MKKIISIILAGLIVLSFTGCSFLDKFQLRTEIKAVGDVILGDGTVIPYAVVAADKTTNDQDHIRVAMVYKIEGKTAYMIGCYTPYNRWCIGNVGAYVTDIKTIHCTVSGSAGNYNFSGDEKGEDNFSQIAAYLGSNNDTKVSGNYPIFEKCQTYIDDLINNATYFKRKDYKINYDDGWYVPSISELYDIYKANKYVKDFYYGLDFRFWSSTPVPDKPNMAYVMNFKTGIIEEVDKADNTKHRDLETFYVRKETIK